MEADVKTLIGNSGVGVDIGGSFAKLVYFRCVQEPRLCLVERQVLQFISFWTITLTLDLLTCMNRDTSIIRIGILRNECNMDATKGHYRPWSCQAMF
jgi:hypothetical protein